MRSSFTSLSAALFLVPAVLAANHDVAVGLDGNLIFFPEFVMADPGDTVNFVFHQKNHSATQSTFDKPCTHMDGGFNSGFMPVADGITEFPNWSVTVNDTTTPIWVFCAQTMPKPHCGQGMVFAINPPPADSDKSFDAFKTAAVNTSGGGPIEPIVSTAPPQSWAEATATMTHDGSTWATTYTSYEGTPQPTMAAEPATHIFVVGFQGQLQYGPIMNISASINDTVVFEFHAKNHTATRSTFDSPCTPMDGGFDSGFHPVAADATEFPTFNITINDTAPIWGYCQQTNPKSHCGSGMVFAINAVETGKNNFAAFMAKATEQFDSTALPAVPSARPTQSSGSGSGSGNGNGNGNGAISVTMKKGVMALSVVGIVFSLL